MLKRWCDNVYGTSERNYETLNKIWTRSSFGRHVGEHGGQYKSYYFAEKSKCHKISPLNAFPLKFRCKIILCALTIFGISKIPTHCLKEALVMWPLSASGLFKCEVREFLTSNKSCAASALNNFINKCPQCIFFISIGLLNSAFFIFNVPSAFFSFQ